MCEVLAKIASSLQNLVFHVRIYATVFGGKTAYD